jgi:hypothetical protein
METINSEYYILVEDSEYPALAYKDWGDFDLDRTLNLNRPIEKMPEFPFDLYLRKPVPRKPKLADYHILFGLEHVVSERVKLTIEEMNPIKIEYLPADIHLNSTGYEEGYFILNIYNVITAMDKAHSEWTKSHNPRPEREVLSIDKLVLDLSKLADIPLQERLIFALGECPVYKLFHESIIDNIARLEPKGFYAVPVKAWDGNGI